MIVYKNWDKHKFWLNTIPCQGRYDNSGKCEPKVTCNTKPLNVGLRNPKVLKLWIKSCNWNERILEIRILVWSHPHHCSLPKVYCTHVVLDLSKSHKSSQSEVNITEVISCESSSSKVNIKVKSLANIPFIANCTSGFPPCSITIYLVEYPYILWKAGVIFPEIVQLFLIWTLWK